MLPPADDTPLKVMKEVLRRQALARRDALPHDARAAAAAAIATRAGDLGLAPGADIAGFLAIRSEIDPLPLMAALEARGHRLCLPVILADKETMIFRQWRIGAELVQSGFGLSVPPSSAAPIEPRHLLVPLAAFDRRGYRIGYGKGHYDRALARLERQGPVVKIGIAFAAQEIDTVPAEPHDCPLDFILTETEFFACEATTG